MSLIAKPTFGAQFLSARQVNTLARWENVLHGRGKSVSVPRELRHMSANSGTNRYVQVFLGNLIHCHNPNHTEYLYYDWEINKDDNSTESVFLRMYYTGIVDAIATLEQPTFGTTRERGRIDMSTFDPHPADGDLVTVVVYAYRSTDADPVQCTGGVYWLDEIPYPTAYTALNDAAALTDGQNGAEVLTQLNNIADNLEPLDDLSRTFYPGFRCVGGGISNDTTGTKEADGQSWRWRTNMDGRLYYRIEYTNWRDSTDGFPYVKLNVKTALGTYQVGTTINLTEPAAPTPAVAEGYVNLTGFLPTAVQQMVLELRIVYGYSKRGESAIRVHFLGEIGDEVGDYAEFGEAVHAVAVYGDSSSPQLRSLWDNCLLLAGDDGTGYGQDGFDVDAGFPVGYAIVNGRNVAVEGANRPGTSPRGLHNIIQMGDGFYQVFCVMRTAAPYLYVRGVGCELVYPLGNVIEKALSIDDFGADGYTVIDMTGVDAIVPGQLYFVRADIGTDGNHIDFAMEGY